MILADCHNATYIKHNELNQAFVFQTEWTVQYVTHFKNRSVDHKHLRTSSSSLSENCIVIRLTVSHLRLG